MVCKGHKWNHKTTGSKREDPSGGSTDVGDVSYIVPEITLMATTAPMNLRGLLGCCS
jgi:hypothetical protein